MNIKPSNVVIAGIGQTPVGEHWELSLRTLAAEAILAAVKDANGLKPQVFYIANLLAAPASKQANLGAVLTENVGMVGVEGVTIEAADASGGAALRMAYLAVRSGAVDVALAVGVEKVTDLIGAEADAVLSQTLDADFETAQGLTPIDLSALLFQRYLHEYQPDRERFAGFAETAHANGANNPNAMFQRSLSKKSYAAAPPAAGPFNRYDIAPYADGAAAVLLTREDLVPKGDRPQVHITGSSLVIDTLATHDRPNPLIWQAARLSTERACRQAGRMPKDMDFFELHDATTLHTVLSLEAAGFAPQGEGWRLAAPDKIGLKGEMPMATMGGLKARGHTLGAAGLYQAVEAILQLRGEAGKSQITGAKNGMIQCLGGPASTAATHILSVKSH
jgi:acetyl-CoA C-acetyltransferase